MSQPTDDLQRVLKETAEKIDGPDVPIAPPPGEATSGTVTPIDNAKPKQRGVRPPAPPAQPTLPEMEEKPTPIIWQKPNYFRGALDKIFGTAEFFKVYKRDELGHQTFIRSYVPKDLDVTRDFEEFIQKYLVPAFGEGQYDVVLVNQAGQNSRAQQFTVADPSRKAGSEESSTSKVIDVLMDRVKGLENKTGASQQKTMTETLQEMKTFMEMMGTGANKADPIVMMKMLEMLRPPTPTGPDPAMTAVLETLKELKNVSARREPMALPPPLPPPAPEPRESIAELLAAVSAVSKPSMDVKDIVALLKPNQETLSVKDLIALIPTLQQMFQPKQDPTIAALAAKIEAMQKPQTTGLQDALQTFQVVESLIQRRMPQNTEGESFWGFMKDFASNFASNVEAIGNMAAKIRAQDASKNAPAAGGTQPSAPPAQKPGMAFPPGFDEKLKVIDAATDAAGRIEATLMAFQFLATEAASWRPFILKVVKLGREYKETKSETAKAKALEFVQKFMEGVHQAKKLTTDPSVIKKDFEDHFEEVAQVLG